MKRKGYLYIILDLIEIQCILNYFRPRFLKLAA